MSAHVVNAARDLAQCTHEADFVMRFAAPKLGAPAAELELCTYCGARRNTADVTMPWTLPPLVGAVIEGGKRDAKDAIAVHSLARSAIDNPGSLATSARVIADLLAAKVERIRRDAGDDARIALCTWLAPQPKATWIAVVEDVIAWLSLAASKRVREESAKRFSVAVQQGRLARSFPIDMLRSERCWPVDEDDSHAIERTIIDERLAGRELVKLESGASYEPASARWESFGWRVVTIEKGEEKPKLVREVLKRARESAAFAITKIAGARTRTRRDLVVEGRETILGAMEAMQITIDGIDYACRILDPGAVDAVDDAKKDGNK